MVKSQQKFLAGLEHEGFVIERSRIVYDHKIREKGVDVKLAIDVVIGATDDTYDVAMIVSSDTDLVPAIRHLRTRGKTSEYVGFSENPSLGMARDNTRSILLLSEDLAKFRNGDEQPAA